MEITKSLKERFCKDNSIGIKIFDEPYFTERLNLYHRAMPEDDILKKWNTFLELLKKYETEKDYFDEYGSIKDAAIEVIKSNPTYQEFNTMDFNKAGFKYDLSYPEKETYKDYNIGKYFISIDMKKANFTALRCFSSKIFNDKPTWEEFLRQFTDSEYILSSKYIRQVIMGNCNPGRQVTYEKYLMGSLLKELLKDPLFHTGLTIPEIVSVKSDEIIIDVSYLVEKFSQVDVYNSFNDKVSEAAEKVNPNLNVRVELFKIEKLSTGDGYKRIFYDGKVHTQYKCLNSYTAPFAFREELGEDVTENDKVFIFEDKLAKFI